ncbi:MAG: GHKL domain-containing protein [Bacteriovoracaceae bacterium]|nr:GHKL domain-containing protein [Bacteriovoracaceae bacterium]
MRKLKTYLQSKNNNYSNETFLFKIGRYISNPFFLTSVSVVSSIMISTFLHIFFSVKLPPFEIMVATVCPLLIAYPVSLLFKSFLQTLNEFDEKNIELNKSLLDRNEELKKNIEDISLMHSKLKETQKQLIQTSKMVSLGTMGAGIAHEINNPLTIILGNVNLLKKQLSKICTESQGPTKKINVIDENCNRILKIVSHIKDFSCDTEAAKSKMKEVNINNLIENLSDFFRWMALDLGIKIIYDLSPDNPKIHADYTFVEQALLNLIHNSIDAMRDSNVKILTLKTEKKKNVLHIYVTDTGAGIPVEIQEQVFDPFFTTKPPNKGTGLGLSLVNTYIQQNDGEISFKSSRDGTSFDIEFRLSS